MAVPTLPLIERSLWFLNLILCSFLGIRLFSLRLASTYRFFTAFLIISVLRAMAMWPIDIRSATYPFVWKLTQPILWILYTLVVLELCSLIFKEYQGIQALGRWTVYGSLAASVFLSTVILAPTWRNSSEPILSTPRFLMVERGIESALVLLLLLLLVFLVLLPIPLSRNVVIHSVLYAAFFVTSSLGILIVNLRGFAEAGRVVSVCVQGIFLFCLVGWVTLLSPEGETKLAHFRKPLPAAYEDRLVEQLANINATLIRASAKVDTSRLVH
jgi:hypothetical protein